MRSFILYLFPACFSFYITAAQPWYLSDHTRNYLLSQCPVCRIDPGRTDHLLPLSAAHALDTCFHNSMILLQDYRIEEAYQGIVNAAARLPEQHNLHLASCLRFLKAKILYFKHLYAPALKEYLALGHSLRNTVLQGNIFTNIGEIYLEHNDFANALAYFRLYLHIADTADLHMLKNVYSNIAICLLDSGKSGQATAYLWKSVAIARQLRDTLSIAKSYLNLANRLYLDYEDKKALRYFKRGLWYAQRSEDLETQENAYLNLSVVEEQQGHYAASLNYRKKYEALHDSIYNRDNIWKLVQQEKKLAVQEKEYRVQLLQQTNQLQVLELNRRSWQRNTFLALSAVLLAFALFIYYVYRQKKMQNRTITRQREQLNVLNHTKDQLLSIVAHDLRSPVKALQPVLARLQVAVKEKNFEAAAEYCGTIEDISANTYSLLNNLLCWVLNQAGQLYFAPEKLDIRKVAEQVCYDYRTIAGSKGIALQISFPGTLYCTGDIQSIKVILRNLIDNAVKYGGRPGVIRITAGEAGHRCYVSVSDNGTGISDSVIKALFAGDPMIYAERNSTGGTGLGLRLIKAMTEKNRGSMDIRRIEGMTMITIYLPKK